MTIGGWILFVVVAVLIVMLGVAAWFMCEDIAWLQFLSVVLTIGIIAGLFFGIRWYLTGVVCNGRN